MALPLIYSFRSIAVRKGSSAMAVLGIALVVMVFVTLLALAAGFSKAVECSGSPQNIIVLRKGADAELQSQVTLEVARQISELPIVANNSEGERLCVWESVVILSRPKRGGGEASFTVRGTKPLSRAIHSDVRLKEGRWLTPGTNEAIVGVGLVRRMANLGLGQEVKIGRDTWRIVGVFEASGSSLESELWMDGPLMQSAFRRRGVFQSVLFKAAGDPQAALGHLNALIGQAKAGEPKPDPRLADPRLQTVEAQTEDEYYRKQAKLVSDLITILGGLLTAIMAVGAIVGAMNTMYAAVSQRKREIGCLLAMGFTPESVWIAFIAESLVLAGLGAAIGCALSLYLDGMKTGTTNWTTFSETAFEFSVTPRILVQASVLALLMGFVGGVAPAFRAARMKVVEALRRV
jgi:ABC-type antimicrobial peptide transport system permease subunit